ncbi:hypothetical protein [Nevskia ramosa]|uniref:hypothetical protein n=1 Tax=Nevskia ramosa TaxID=64002 RepID=UPI0003B60151|nr:hypothetical protein [Nevskia ramosa]
MLRKTTQIARKTAETTVAKAVARDLKGWKVVTKSQPLVDMGSSAMPHVKKGVELTTLRKKYFRPKSGVVDAIAPVKFKKQSKDHKTVLVQPKKGGSAKVAEFVDGHIRIIQG